MLVLAAGLGIFAAVAIAVRYHFKSAVTPVRFMALAAISAVNVFIFGRELWRREQPFELLVAALLLFVLSAVMFGWTLWASRTARLKLIYDADKPTLILRDGPYRYIRHPFYASYLPFWLGCALATMHWANILYFVLLVPLLTHAARAEEEGFMRSAVATDYAAYRREAGMFWPKL